MGSLKSKLQKIGKVLMVMTLSFGLLLGSGGAQVAHALAVLQA